jgi:pseudouridine synthase
VRQRLQKILASAGYGSRRSAEALIAAGHVRVNGRVVTQAGSSADSALDLIEVDGVAIGRHSAFVYIAMHKPTGRLTTLRDARGRPTVMDLLPDDLPPHVVPVGRLDLNTEGLLLFTNDGDFAFRMTHPRYEVEKEYLALVSGSPSQVAMNKLRTGVSIEGGHRTRPAVVSRARAPRGHIERTGHAWLRLVIHEGRKRQVRLMCAAVGHQVRALVRVRVGGVSLGGLRRGATRPLTEREAAGLKRAVGL